MLKRKKNVGCETPIFRKPTEPPKPNNNRNPPNRGSSVQPPKKPCTYETPCGWCSKWDKKCDKKIGGGNDAEPRKKKDAVLEWIKSGNLPPLDTNDTYGLELRP